MMKKQFAALPAIVAIAVVAQSGGAQAVDYTIVDGQTETTTQTLTTAGDTLLVEDRGAVNSGDNGVVLDAADQVLTNNGAIAASLTGVIVNGADALITNYGTISSSTSAYHGLQSNAVNTELVNFGGIHTYADCAYGVWAVADHFTLTNDGIITTIGDYNSYGVYIESADYAMITNNGLIQTYGDRADGISAWWVSNATIINDGAIVTSGTDSIGIYVYENWGEESGNLLINNGTIRATGLPGGDNFGQAIYANAAGMTVINSGSVYSQYAEAIYMKQANQTLTLLDGSIIEGDIRFDQGASATLNIGRGVEAQLTLTGMPGTINTDGQAYAIDGDVLVVVSTETIGAGGTAASSTSGAIATAVGGHVGSRRQAGSGGAAPLGYAPSPAAPDFPDFAPSDNFGAWASVFGGASAPVNGKTGIQTGQAGGLVGFDTRLSGDSLAGIFAGFGQGVVNVESGASVDTTTLIGGAYGSFALGAGFVDVNATLGASSNRSKREFLNNKAVDGVEKVSGQYGSYFFSPSVTVGIDHELGGARITPSVSLMYAGIFQDGYTETGAISSLTLGSQATHVLTARGEVELGTIRQSDAPNGWNGSVRLGAEGIVTNGSAINASLLGSSFSLAGSQTTEARGFVGMDLGFTQNGYNVSAKSEVGYSTMGILSATVNGGIGARF